METKVLSGPFKGSSFPADWKSGKRKILGVYEHEINRWWKSVLTDCDVFYDVGAADGYHSRGVAWNMRKCSDNYIYAFEPGPHMESLKQLVKDQRYPQTTFELVKKFVGESDSEKMTTLDQYFREPCSKGIIKIDVEGAEVDVLKGARKFLETERFEWVVEIHGESLIEPVKVMFDEYNIDTELIHPKRHWLLGPEPREIWTGWMVSK